MTAWAMEFHAGRSNVEFLDTCLECGGGNFDNVLFTLILFNLASNVLLGTQAGKSR